MARSHEETTTTGPGRSAHQSAQPIGETPHGKMDQPVGSGDNWGYQPRKGGMALEARLGMFIIVILLGAFGFLVYRKFDQHRHQLLAGENLGTLTDDDGPASGDAEPWIATPAAADSVPLHSSPADHPQLAKLHVAQDADIDEEFSLGEAGSAEWDTDNAPTDDVAADADPFAGLVDLPASDGDFGNDRLNVTAAEQDSSELSLGADDPYVDFDAEPIEPEDPQDAVSINPDSESVSEPLPYADDVVLDFGDDSASSEESRFADSADVFHGDGFDGDTAVDSDAAFDLDLVATDEDFRPPAASMDAPPAHESDFPIGDDDFDTEPSADREPVEELAASEPEPSAFGPPPDLGESSLLDDLLFDDTPQTQLRPSSQPYPPRRETESVAQDERQLLIPNADFSAEREPAGSASFETDQYSDSDLLADDDNPFPFPVTQSDNDPFAELQPPATADEPDRGSFFPDDQPIAYDSGAQDVRFSEDVEEPVDGLPDAVPPRATVQHAIDDDTQPVSTSRRNPASPVSSQVVMASAEQDPCDVVEVEPNDNYWKISRRAYGSTRYFAALARYNQHRIPNPRRLRPGMKVLVPSVDVLEARYPKLFRSTQPAEEKKSGYFVQSDGSAAYRIGESDTLSDIAKQHLGRSSRWIEIYRSNRNVLQNPNRLKPGTVIALPDDATDVHVIP